MARHGRHRYAAIRERPRTDGHGDGWRQIVKTPTFALGVAVVAAALLAFGTTQTYLRFSGSGPDNGCRAAPCANPAASPTPGPSSPGTAHAGGQASAVQVTYSTLSTWSTGFTGELTIRNRSKRELTAWRLTISYKHAHISRVRGGRRLPQAEPTSATIEPGPQSDPLGAGNSVRISYNATGDPHAPIGCEFNGTRCKIK